MTRVTMLSVIIVIDSVLDEGTGFTTYRYAVRDKVMNDLEDASKHQDDLDNGVGYDSVSECLYDAASHCYLEGLYVVDVQLPFSKEA